MSFVKILQVCYEPYVALAVIGLLACMLLRRWKIFISGILLLVAMISWRVSIAGEGSSRYGLAVLFPVMFFVLIAGSEIEKYVTAKFSRVKKNTFTVIFCAVMVAFSFGKIFRFDSGRNTALKYGKAIRSDAAKFTSVLIVGHANNKEAVVSIYAEKPFVMKEYWHEITEHEVKIIQNEAFNYLQYYDAVYFFVKDKQYGKFLKNIDGLFQLNAPDVDNNYAVYRVTETFDTSSNAGNVMKNGDFSQTIPFAVKVPVNRQLSCPSGIMPAGWFVNFGHGCNIGSNAEVEVVKAWDGNALRIYSETGTAVAAECFFTPAGTRECRVQYKLTEGQISFIAYMYDKNRQYKGFKVIDKISCVDNKIHEFRCRIFFDDSEVVYFRPVFEIEGSAILDNLSLTEVK